MSVPAESDTQVVISALSGVSAKESLSAEAREAVLRERLALAQELHETLCQSLSGARLIATLAERKAAQRHPELTADLTELRGMVGSMCDDVHRIVEQLRTPARLGASPID